MKALPITYGFDARADIRAISAISKLDWDRFTAVTHLEIRSGQQTGDLDIDGVLGSHSCYAPLAALGAARAVRFPFAKALEALAKYSAPKGRMRCIPGLKGTIVIDDTYNSSPAAAMKALDALAALSPKQESGKRIAVLGNMAELGTISVASHEDVGKHAAKLAVDFLITVGDKSADTARAAREAGMPEEKIFEFGQTEEAGRFLQERMKPGDLVLIKGSQSARMERIAKEVMANPLKAGELLVRQEAEWVD